MTAYNVEYSYSVEEFGNTLVNADDVEQAEMFAREYVQETYPEAYAITIDKTQEI